MRFLSRYIIVTFFVLILSSLFLQGSYFSSGYDFFSPKNVITVFGNRSNQNNRFLNTAFVLNSLKDKNTLHKLTVIIEKNTYNASKNFSGFVNKSKHVFFELFSDGVSNEIIHRYDGKKDYQLNFEKYVNNKFIKLKYDVDLHKLNFSIPGGLFNINGQYTMIEDFVFYGLEHVVPGTVMQFGEEYTLSIVDELEKDIEIFEDGGVKEFRLSHENLFSDNNYSFDSSLWNEDVLDCSNKMDGQADISMGKENVSDGNVALRLASKNHYACTNTSFSVELNKDKMYKLSFDYKNIEGHDVRYYYRFRDSDNDNMRYYAVADTFKAEDHEWHNYSVIIDPDKIVEDLIYPENSGEGLGGFNMNRLKDEQKRIIKDIDFMDIYFYAPSDGTRGIINLYDNVRFEEYEFTEIREIDFDLVLNANIVLAEGIYLTNGENSFEYVLNEKNFFNEKIASVENGLWRESVEDCSENKPGSPEINLEESTEASSGSRSIKLSSTNHYACVNKTFPVQLSDGKTYKLQFDYKNIKGQDVMYYYNLRSNDKNEAYSEVIKAGDNEWHTFETIIEPGISEVKNIDIFFYAPSDGSKEIINLYDNVRLTEWLPKDIDSYYLYAEQEVDEMPKLDAVEYKAVNRWKNKVVLHGVKDSFLLAYPEKYSEKWKAYTKTPQNSRSSNFDPLYSGGGLENYIVPEVELNRQATKDEVQKFIDEKLISNVGGEFISKNFDGSIRNDNLDDGWFGETFFKSSIPEDMHYQINNYGNSWWVDIDKICKEDNKCIQNDDGTYDIALVIEHKFNRYANLIFWGSGLVFVGLLGYLGYDLIKKRRKNKRGLVK